MMDDGIHGLPAIAQLDPIPRPGSMSLPGIAAFTSGADASGRSSPQIMPAATTAPATPLAATAAAALSTTSPAATTAGGSGGHMPICQNCATSTTPLWRRDEMGSVLCNACGLFLKLHGRARPISLKTDVIKSRNRVKTSMRPDMAMKKKNNTTTAAATAAAAAAAMTSDPNGMMDLQGQAYAATAALSAQQASQNPPHGHINGNDSSLAGTSSPGMYSTHPSASYSMIDESQYQGQHLQAFGAPDPTGHNGHNGSPLNGDARPEAPQTQEQLAADNASLKTRVSELEVINDFIQRRLGEMEQYSHDGSQDATASSQQQQEAAAASDAQLRSQVELLTQSEIQLRTQLDESRRRENMLKRRLDELEQELKHVKDASSSAYQNGRAAKRARLDSSPDGDGADDAAVASTNGTAAVATATESGAEPDAPAAGKNGAAPSPPSEGEGASATAAADAAAAAAAQDAPTDKEAPNGTAANGGSQEPSPAEATTEASEAAKASSPKP